MNKNVKIKSAAQRINSFDLSHNHITTEKFYEPNVVFVHPVIAGSQMTIRVGTFRRIDPMPLPPLTKIKCNTKFYYVPYIDVYHKWLEFKAQTKIYDGLTSWVPTKVPYITNATIWSLLQGSQYSSTTTDPNFDFAVGAPRVCYKLTKKGRYAYKVLKQLGYDFETQFNQQTDYEMNGLPLLAFGKIICDYYFNPMWYDYNSDVETVIGFISSTNTNNDTANRISLKVLESIIKLGLAITYEKDIFTTAWTNPNGSIVNSSIQPTITAKVNDNSITGGADQVRNDVYNTAVLNNSSNNNLKGITKLGLSLLAGFQNFLSRHQIAGSRYVDRILAEYGINVNNSYSHRTSKIDEVTSIVTIQPVFNQSDTLTGDYAGYGQSASDQKDNIINIDVPDIDGIVIAIDTLIPEVYYGYGLDMNNMHVNRFDFYTPEFDALGTQAIPQICIRAIHDVNYNAGNSQFTLPFGFTPRYSEYKQKTNKVSGDFINPSVNLDIDGYTTVRKFKLDDWTDANNKTLFVQSPEFNDTYDSEQYTRIFYTNTAKTDYVKSVFAYDVLLKTPMKQIFDYYEFNDGSGQEFNMSINGEVEQ